MFGFFRLRVFFENSQDQLESIQNFAVDCEGEVMELVRFYESVNYHHVRAEFFLESGDFLRFSRSDVGFCRWSAAFLDYF